jgi:20S proteasome alpha/beta subunit
MTLPVNSRHPHVAAKDAEMNFLLAGFKEGGGSRHYSFDCVASDRSRTTVIVGADMALARKHEIRLQELPLLCVRLLESLGTTDCGNRSL